MSKEKRCNSFTFNSKRVCHNNNKKEVLEVETEKEIYISESKSKSKSNTCETESKTSETENNSKKIKMLSQKKTIKKEILFEFTLKNFRTIKV
jgi:hypothetical protein